MLRIAVAAVLVAIGGWALSNRGIDKSEIVRQAATNAISVSPETTAPVAGQPSVNAVASASAVKEETRVATLSLVGTTADLTDADLEKLVAELDGMESLPSAEPQPITITDDDLGTIDENTNR